MEDPLAPGSELYWLVESRYQTDGGIKIDKKLRIDLKHLKFEALIGQSGYSIVYKGV